jgi:hemerythrin-like domain-containing protein
MDTRAPRSAASPFARFRRDHRRVLARLSAMEATAPGRRGVLESPLRRHLATLARQFDTHMAAEEAVLYPALAVAFPEARGTLAPLHEEHADLRAMLSSLGASLDQPAGGERNVQIAIQVRDFVDLLRVHIRKEESVVFDVSERVLKARELRGLARRLAPFFPARERRVTTRRVKGKRS